MLKTYPLTGNTIGAFYITFYDKSCSDNEQITFESLAISP